MGRTHVRWDRPVMLGLRRGSVDPRLLELCSNVEETFVPSYFHLDLQMWRHSVELIVFVVSDVHEPLTEGGDSQPLGLVLRGSRAHSAAGQQM